MNTRRFVLYLIIGLLTFLIGVTAAVALGGFNPLERLSRNHSRRQLTIPPQPLSPTNETSETYSGCRQNRLRVVELHHYNKSLVPPPPPVMPVAPFDEESETTPVPQRATR